MPQRGSLGVKDLEAVDGEYLTKYVEKAKKCRIALDFGGVFVG